MNPTANIFTNLPVADDTETFEELAQGDGVLIERIVSRGHRSADGFWYQNSHAEWVMVVKGEAILSWEEGGSVRLGAGDHVDIPALCRHRVAWTDPDQETVWLAVHYPAKKKPGRI